MILNVYKTMLKHGAGTSDVARRRVRHHRNLPEQVPDVPAKRATDTPPLQNPSASSQSLANRIGRLLSDRHAHKTSHIWTTAIVMIPQFTSSHM